MIRKEFHYLYEDAKKAAEAFAAENNGVVAGDITADEKSLQGCSYMDDRANNLCWSGEVDAISVEDKEGNIIGLFASWDWEE